MKDAEQNTIWLRPEEAIKMMKDYLGSKGKLTPKQIRTIAEKGFIRLKSRKNGMVIDSESLYALAERVNTGEVDLEEISVSQTEEETTEAKETPAPPTPPSPPKSEASQQQTSAVGDKDIKDRKPPSPSPSVNDNLLMEVKHLKNEIAELQALRTNVLSLADQLPTLIEQHASKVASETVQEAVQQMMAMIGGGQPADISGMPPNSPGTATETHQASATPGSPSAGPAAGGIDPSQIPSSVIEKQLQLELMERLPKMQALDKLILAVSNPGFAKLLGVVKTPPGQPQQVQDGSETLVNAMRVLSEIQKMFTEQTVSSIKAFKQIVEAEKTTSSIKPDIKSERTEARPVRKREVTKE